MIVKCKGLYYQCPTLRKSINQYMQVHYEIEHTDLHDIRVTIEISEEDYHSMVKQMEKWGVLNGIARGRILETARKQIYRHLKGEI